MTEQDPPPIEPGAKGRLVYDTAARRIRGTEAVSADATVASPSAQGDARRVALVVHGTVVDNYCGLVGYRTCDVCVRVTALVNSPATPTASQRAAGEGEEAIRRTLAHAKDIAWWASECKALGSQLASLRSVLAPLRDKIMAVPEDILSAKVDDSIALVTVTFGEVRKLRALLNALAPEPCDATKASMADAAWCLCYLAFMSHQICECACHSMAPETGDVTDGMAPQSGVLTDGRRADMGETL